MIPTDQKAEPMLVYRPRGVVFLSRFFLVGSALLPVALCVNLLRRGLPGVDMWITAIVPPLFGWCCLWFVCSSLCLGRRWAWFVSLPLALIVPVCVTSPFLLLTNDVEVVARWLPLLWVVLGLGVVLSLTTLVHPRIRAFCSRSGLCPSCQSKKKEPAKEWGGFVCPSCGTEWRFSPLMSSFEE